MENVKIAKILKGNGVKFWYKDFKMYAFCNQGLNWINVSGWSEKQILRKWVV